MRYRGFTIRRIVCVNVGYYLANGRRGKGRKSVQWSLVDTGGQVGPVGYERICDTKKEAKERADALLS